MKGKLLFGALCIQTTLPELNIFTLSNNNNAEIFMLFLRPAFALCRILLLFRGEMTDETMINLLDGAHAPDGVALNAGRILD